jgi:hypothetical protein
VVTVFVLQKSLHTTNGARAAFERVIDCEGNKGEGEYDMPLVDRLLTALWLEGYCVMPVEASGHA